MKKVLNFDWKKLGIWTIRAACVLLVLVGFWGYLLTDILLNDVADADSYLEVLYEKDIYTRIHTELLADPAFEEGITDLLRLIGLEQLGADVYSLSTSTLYLVIPPSSLQMATESFITNFVGYINGQSDRLNPDITLGSIFEIQRLEDRLTVAVEQAIRNQVRVENPEMSPTDVSREVYKQARQLSGQVPVVTTSVRSIEGLSDAQVSNLARILMRPMTESESDLLLQVEAALAAGDLSGGLTLVARGLIAEQLNTIMVSFVTALSDTGSINTLEVAAASLGMTIQQVSLVLNFLRDWVSMARQVILPICWLMMLSGVGGLLFTIRKWHVLRQIRVLGFVLSGVGLASLFVWMISRKVLVSMLDQSVMGLSGGLPESLNMMIEEVILGLVENWWMSGLWMITILGVIGILFFGLSFYALFNRWFVDFFRPVLAEKRATLVGLILSLIVIIPAFRGLVRIYYQPQLPCNGAVELCERSVNKVVFATTHNSMSIAEYGWIWPSHDGDVTDQLEFGIRGLLLDTHYFDATASATSYMPDATPQELAVVSKAIERVGLEEREGTYVCHVLCHLGSTPLVDTLTEVRDFLDRHPREVVVIVFEDKISPADTEQAFAESGLDRYVYTHRTGEVWPTLGRLIMQNQRLVVMAEVAGPPPAWYMHAWDYVQETPYSFAEADEFSCEPNRGGHDKPFFLMNHWIERVSPSRVDASTVNTFDVLYGRAKMCESERGKMPNLIAVNFYQIGDVIQVVQVLNEMGE